MFIVANYDYDTSLGQNIVDVYDTSDGSTDKIKSDDLFAYLKGMQSKIGYENIPYCVLGASLGYKSCNMSHIFVKISETSNYLSYFDGYMVYGVEYEWSLSEFFECTRAVKTNKLLSLAGNVDTMIDWLRIVNKPYTDLTKPMYYFSRVTVQYKVVGFEDDVVIVENINSGEKSKFNLYNILYHLIEDEFGIDGLQSISFEEAVFSTGEKIRGESYIRKCLSSSDENSYISHIKYTESRYGDYVQMTGWTSPDKVAELFGDNDVLCYGTIRVPIINGFKEPDIQFNSRYDAILLNIQRSRAEIESCRDYKDFENLFYMFDADAMSYKEILKGYGASDDFISLLDETRTKHTKRMVLDSSYTNESRISESLLYNFTELYGSKLSFQWTTNNKSALYRFGNHIIERCPSKVFTPKSIALIHLSSNGVLVFNNIRDERPKRSRLGNESNLEFYGVMSEFKAPIMDRSDFENLIDYADENDMYMYGGKLLPLSLTGAYRYDGKDLELRRNPVITLDVTCLVIPPESVLTKNKELRSLSTPWRAGFAYGVCDIPLVLTPMPKYRQGNFYLFRTLLEDIIVPVDMYNSMSVCSMVQDIAMLRENSKKFRTTKEWVDNRLRSLFSD